MNSTLALACLAVLAVAFAFQLYAIVFGFKVLCESRRYRKERGIR